MLSLLYVFLGSSLLNLTYYASFLKFGFKKSESEPQKTTLPVSVIICAKNEAENLRRFLPAILDQDHDDFEVVLINDASIDDTLEVMEDFQRKDPRVKLVNVKNVEAFWANKKYALTLGIKKASKPYLLFTDADCEPETRHWIREMSGNFSQNTSIALGYGGYFSIKRSLLNKLIRFETLMTAVQYFSYSLWGLPYMGVGRNLAYTSDKFFDQTGFAGHLHLRSGDDDLFVNRAASSANTSVCFSQNSFTRSIPKKSFQAWIAQKRRHVSTARHYKLKHRLLLGLFYLSQLLFWVLFFTLLFGTHWKLALGVLGLRILLQSILFYKAGRKLKETDLIWLFPFLELFLICAQMGIFIANIVSKPTHWK